MIERSILDQLADLGIRSADIRYAAFSHLHFDHVGAANALALAGVDVLMQKAEWHTAFASKGAERFHHDYPQRERHRRRVTAELPRALVRAIQGIRYRVDRRRSHQPVADVDCSFTQTGRSVGRRHLRTRACSA